jgi:DNA-binding Lrp family transcriptional regulator
MTTRTLDRIDRRILALLQQDGRITHAALAQRVSLSPRACLDRVRRLEREGYITGYRACLDPRRVSQLVTVIAEVTLTDQRRTTRQVFEKRVQACEEVIECHLVSGTFDYLVRFACRDLDHYRELTSAWIDDVRMGVARVVSCPELETVKEFRGYPLPE